ncbi:hypothetical protein [uncultured Aureimonas sp.]|uniref:hypothetical protein n=1 Tax=uncultured Aureimonas sp. TaxID=1604662 RepID=UPI0025FE39CE|nr:hypothetical protein [uncultured Aureimonas sp.]
MVIALRPDVRERLVEIELEDGVPVLEQVMQAVEVWSHLTTPERRTIMMLAMRIIAQRGKEPT